ncbi:MAG: hypothetical protein QOE94_3659 [Mycobacterium sp.]|jgi:hypothetical protein|nr:hypothetical protein [Mycobacterium sp.]MDT7722648.1 hypothetical protein [Mycobacterium sp.]
MQGLPAMCSVFAIVLYSNSFQPDQPRFPVIAEFTSPGPRTIFMRIVDGEGSGSLVETHATPLGPDRDGRPRTAVLESGHRAFPTGPDIAHATRRCPDHPLMRHAATRLRRGDLAYAERRYALRTSARP